MIETAIKQRKKYQVISCRLKYDTYNTLELKCLEDRQPMSAIIHKAVKKYLKQKHTFVTQGE